MQGWTVIGRSSVALYLIVRSDVFSKKRCEMKGRSQID